MMQRRQLRRLAVKLVRSFISQATPGIGVTVIVHSAAPLSTEWPLWVETTLPSRGHYRALFGEAIAMSVIADGGDVDTAGDVAAQDYNAVVRDGRDRPS
jgi:hypothetical protein